MEFIVFSALSGFVRRSVARPFEVSSFLSSLPLSKKFIIRGIVHMTLSYQVVPDLLHTVRTCDDFLKEYIMWKLGTLVSIVRQHVRKYLPDLLSLISELWSSSFSLPVTNRPVHGSSILHLLEQLCLALNDEFRTHLPSILPSCIQVLSDAERSKDYTYVVDILRTIEVFGGTYRNLG
ncbi:hypothetical protein ACS0TY_022558 [Phlomoides rotata]